MNNSFNADDAIGKHLASHPSYSDFLCHHGIKGQKWGVRRFQNKDGSLTADGRKRYGTGNGRHTRTSRSAKSAISSDPTLSAMDNDYLGANSLRKSPEDATAAANLGLKALVKIRPDDSLNPEDKFDQDWFLNEDQTFGLPTAANFVNKGYSAEDIKKFFKAVNENADYDSDDYSNYFDVMESGYKYRPEKIDKFIDECVSIRDGESKSYKPLSKSENTEAKKKYAEGFSNEERTMAVRDPKRFTKMLDDSVNTSAIKDKSQKLAKERQLLDLWTDDSVEVNSKKAWTGAALQKRINTKSIDVYNSKPVSEGAKNLYRKYKAAKGDWNKRNSLENEIGGQALRDIGYEDTDEHRKKILRIMFEGL